MKEIKLTDNFVALVDDEDYEFLSRFNWSAHYKGGKWYADLSISMHRFILNLHKADGHVDHINGNTLDNRRSNLRTVTRSQNQMNAKRREDNTSGYKGVSRHNNKWMARISINGKRFFLGHFDTPIEAAKAYDTVAKEYCKEFAQLNFPE